MDQFVVPDKDQGDLPHVDIDYPTNESASKIVARVDSIFNLLSRWYRHTGTASAGLCNRDLNVLMCHLEIECAAIEKRNWYRRNSLPQTDHSVAGKNARPIRRHKFPIPNFNIKHPAMLVPIAMAAKRTGTELFCEVSPRETYLFHGIGNARNARDTLETAFRRLRKDMADVEAQTNAGLRLHLDHADDLDIIRQACDAGFDSIMADGSSRSLSQNILFTQAAGSVVRPYGCMLEGEIGSLDGYDASKWSHTNFADFETFVNETDLDFVGISVGQFHGFDYGFTTTREFLEQHAHNVQIDSHRRHYVLLEALSTLEKELEGASLSSTSLERRHVRQWAAELVRRQPSLSVETFISGWAEHGGVRILSLIDRLTELYYEISHSYAKNRSGYWDKILSYRQNEARKANAVNHSLLRSCSRAMVNMKTRLVIHGGSSLNWSDLRELHRYDVARVNFGTTVFSRFLDALATHRDRHSPKRNVASSAAGDYRRLMTFLDEAARDWRDWLVNPPDFLEPFVDWIIENTTDPLNAGVETESLCHVL